MGVPSTTIRTTLSQDQFENVPRWEARLTDGLLVYSDNEYIDGKSDWERLGDYCRKNNLKIDTFLIAFRDHKVHIDKAEGYYFRRMFLASFGGGSKEYFVVGGGIFPEITVYKYVLPELMLFETDVRSIEKEDLL